MHLEVMRDRLADSTCRACGVCIFGTPHPCSINYGPITLFHQSVPFILLFQVATKVDDAIDGTVWILKKHYS